jgi:dTDP-4-amino-4,6-dideoxygalactose transaminase
MDSLSSVARKYGLKLIEDAAQAHGARWNGRRAGSLGDAAAFSFYPSKNLGALGDGGAICTNDDDVAAAARALRHIGQRTKGLHELLGWNERLDGLQAALLSVKLPHLDGWNEQRRHHSEALRGALEDHVAVLEVRDAAECVYHLFPVRSANRASLHSALDAAGVNTGIHYSPAVHQQPVFRTQGTSVTWPNSEAWADQELSLPMFEHLTAEELSRVAECVREQAIPP